MLIRKTIILVLFFTAFHFKNYSQSEPYRRFQIGLSTNANTPVGDYFTNKNIPAAFPGLPIPLTVNVKVKRHEFVFGPDFYRLFVSDKRRLIGLDASYRYHFYRPGKKKNFYLDISAYYVEFAYGGPNLFASYNFSKMDPNTNCTSIYKIQTPAASTGAGIELPFLNYFTFFAHVGFGFIYVHNELDKTCINNSNPALPNSFVPTANVVFGFACYFFTKKQLDSNHGLQTVEKQPK